MHKGATVKHLKAFRLVGPLIAAALLASCSVVRTAEWQNTTRHALLDAYAGKPVTHITYLLPRYARTLEVVSANQLVTWPFRQAHAYLITVGKGCPDLRSTGVSIISPGGDVWAHFDDVLIFDYNPGQPNACEIQTIQPVDLLRVQRDLGRMKPAGRQLMPSDVTTRSG
jgi:hypothetical protein